MQMRASLDLDHFPDSPYASELRREFPDLRFSTELEREFQAFHVDRARSRVQFFQLAIFLLSLAAGVYLTVLDHVPVPSVLQGWLGIVIPVSLLLVLASWTRYYERIYLPLATVMLP